MSNSTLTARVHELRELKRMADEINAQMEAITDEIKAHMTAENKEEISGTDWKCTWKNVKSTRFDSKTFKAENKALYDRYSVTTTTRRFSIA